MSEIGKQVEERLAQVVQPLRDQLAMLDQEIEQKEAELKEFRDARTRLKGVMKGLVPSQNGTRPKAGKKVSGTSIPSAEKLAQGREWIAANRDLLLEKGPFWAKDLLTTYPSFPIKNDSQTRGALRVFHSEGLLQLASIGRGGAKQYKVV